MSTESTTSAGPGIGEIYGLGGSACAVETSGSRSPFAFPRSTDEAVRNAHIIIIDDEQTVTRTVRRHLERAGFRRFTTVSESDVAVERINVLNPDLILLDVHMQPVSGLDILKWVRRNDQTRQIPVIILTSASDEDTKIEALNLGANDFLTKPVGTSELVARVRNNLSAKACVDILADYSAQLESDILSDALTGIANRRAFDYELRRRIIEWNRQRSPLGLLMVDIDFFKTFNDRHGHRVGDIVLRAVAQELEECMREMDLVARYGGEEFAVILPATTSSEARHAGERAREAIAGHEFRVGDQQMQLSVSVGIANAMNGDDAELLICRADAALYAAKQNGRNRSYFHDGGSCLPVATTAPDTSAPNPLELPRNSNVRSTVENARIAIVDDESVIITTVRKHLKNAGFSQFISINESVEALDIIRCEEPDIVLLDIHMPHVDGIEILKNLRIQDRTKRIPVLILTSSTDTATKVEALNLGANDFLEKPVNSSELTARVRNTLLAKSHVDYLADYTNQLEHEVRLRTSELFASRREAIQCLARAAEIRDDETGRHVLRVGRYAAIIAQELGLSEERITWLEHSAQLHDVGKIGVPDEILNKPDGLTSEEFDIMKEHCAVGSRIIRDDAVSVGEEVKKHAELGASIFDDCNSPVMRMAARVAETHHEKWDGSGYPNGLAGNDIPIEGRITAVADVFDALSTKRPYKQAIPLDRCFEIMEENRGTHFDPLVLDAFLRRKAEIIRTHLDYTDAT